MRRENEPMINLNANELAVEVRVRPRVVRVVCPTCGQPNFISVMVGENKKTCDGCHSELEVVWRQPGKTPVAPDTVKQAPKPEQQPLRNADLVFYADHVEICSATIVSDRGAGQVMLILNELRRKDGGRYVRRSSEDLATAIGASCVGTVTSCIRYFRKRSRQILRNCCQKDCGDQDVIVSDEQGYHLNDHLVVRDGDLPHPNDGQAAPAGAAPKSAIIAIPGLTKRQEWVIEQLRQKDAIRRPTIEKHFKVSAKTAKRDLTKLVRLGHVEYVRAPYPGHYRLRRPLASA